MRPERISRKAGCGPADSRRASVAQRVRGLYAVTPDIGDVDALAASVAAAIDGGARVVQYRNKSLPRHAQRVQASRLARLCAAHDVLFIVNDDPQLAHEANAGGVHVGEDDHAIDMARSIVGADRIVGVSCYDDPGRARAAVAQGADYVAFGSFFASSVKPSARRAGIDLLVRSRDLGVPVVAIGGITSANAKALIDAGASAVAVISDVFAHDSPRDIAHHAKAIASLFAEDETT